MNDRAVLKLSTLPLLLVGNIDFGIGNAARSRNRQFTRMNDIQTDDALFTFIVNFLALDKVLEPGSHAAHLALPTRITKAVCL
jgi:hypothetical protein